MKTEEQVREMVSNGLDILDARDHQSLLWVTPWTECQLNILGEWKTNHLEINPQNSSSGVPVGKKLSSRRRMHVNYQYQNQEH